MEKLEFAGHTAWWAPDEADWREVADRVMAESVVGFDTEFYDCDPRYESTVSRAKIHVWSLAVFTGRTHPRGYREAVGVTLPREALLYAPIRQAMEAGVPLKVAHNSPVDAHSVRGAGVEVGGLVNTLSLVRFLAPGRLIYGLKPLMREFLGRTPLGDFDALFSNPVMGSQVETRCACGVGSCRRRKLPEHTKSKVSREVPTKRTTRVPLQSIVPGHRLFPCLAVYAAEDAVGALELYDYLHFTGSRRAREMPW